MKKVERQENNKSLSSSPGKVNVSCSSCNLSVLVEES